MHLALAQMDLLCWVSYLVESMRDYTSLFSSRTDVDSFVVQAPEVLANPYVSCLILLSNTVGLLFLFVESVFILSGEGGDNLLVRQY